MLGERKGVQRVDVVRFREGGARRTRDEVALEEPLEIRVQQGATTDEGPAERSIAVTMRTPGADFELAAGFLFSEAVLEDSRQIREIAYCASEEQRTYNVVTVSVRAGVELDLGRLDRNFYVSSSCGVCGKASLDAVEQLGCALLPDLGERWPAELLVELPDALRHEQSLFTRTGGLHAAGVFALDGRPECVREDVGRHNAVDKVVGSLFLERRLPLERRALVISGRASFEILQKAVRAGLATVVAVGAPSSLAVDLAQRFNVTLAGFARAGGFNVYAGPERVTFP